MTLAANLWATLIFSGLWLLGGATQPWHRYWQPATVAALYLTGQICTFLALDRGDISVAAPIFSVKVLMVAVFLTTVAGESLSGWIWFAAAAATLGVALIQRTGSAGRRRHVMFTIVFALLAATNYAMFDVLVQRWSPAWGAGRFLPSVFGIAGVLSLGFLPWVRRDAFWQRPIFVPLMLGGSLIALQSLCIVLAVAVFGDAARVNIVYSVRGIWGVGLAWIFAHWLGGGESFASRHDMGSRMFGAILLTVAVVVAIVWG